MRTNIIVMLLCSLAIAACGGGGGGGGGGPAPVIPPEPTLDEEVRTMIAAEGLTGDPTAGRNLPSINEPLAQLGKLLFFSKSLSGDFDTACASCHHPALGGGDGLALAIGTGAIDPDVVGPGRARSDGMPNVGRHSQSVFNVGLYDDGMFWDLRVESIGKTDGQNGTDSGIRTPDSLLNSPDMLVPANTSLVAAQARFPVTVPEEMLGSLLPGADGVAVRTRLAERIGDYGSGAGEIPNNNWLAEFQAAFGSTGTAEQLVTFDNIALALGEYQRSMVFVETPWKAYVEGNNNAINARAKEGALLFFGGTAPGVSCGQCHSGDFFTNERMSVTGFPQLGPGKGDGATGDHDFGRERETSDSNDRFSFRTPTLLNLEATGPYSHSGVYSFNDSLAHYFLPQDTLAANFVAGAGVCSVPQFENHPDCRTLFPNLIANSRMAFNQVELLRTTNPDMTFPNLDFSPPSDAPLLDAFIRSLTDPCTLDRACLAPWIPDPSEAPDGNQLNAVDANGNPL